MQFGCGLFAPGPSGDTEAVRTWVKFEANTTVDDLRMLLRRHAAVASCAVCAPYPRFGKG